MFMGHFQLMGKAHAGGALFKIPQKLDYNNLIPNLYTSSNSATENMCSDKKIGKTINLDTISQQNIKFQLFFHSHNALIKFKSGISNMIYAFSSLFTNNPISFEKHFKL